MKQQNNALIYSIYGNIKNYATGTPIKGLKVKAYDKDFFTDQFLGEGKTNESGNYRIEFSKKDFQKLFKLERHPDIYINVYNHENDLLYSTQTCVELNAGTNTAIDINLKMDTLPENKEISFVKGSKVNLKKVAKLNKYDLLDAYRLSRRPHLDLKNKAKILEAFPHLIHFPESKDENECNEGSMEAIRWFLKERDAEQLIDENDLDNFDAGVDVKEFFTTNILVTYTLDPTSSDKLTGTFDDMPAADQAYTLTDGTNLGTVRLNLTDLHADNAEVAPIYIQKIGLIAEYALSQYINPPFSYIDPRNGAARMEFRVLVQPPGGAGITSQSWSHVEVDIDNSDSQNSFTVPHELFHQVQYRYNDVAIREDIYGIIREGGARFNTESINDQPNRYVSSGKTIFDNPEVSLQTLGGGVKNPIRYAAGLFWKYIAEQHSPNTGAANEPAIGVEIYRYVLEETTPANAGYTIAGLRAARRRMPWYGHFDLFRYYDAAKTELDKHETTWGNYLIANYMHGLMQPGDADYDARFDYMEDENLVPFDGGIAKLADLQANVDLGNQMVIGQNDAIVRNVVNHKAYAAKYYEITLNAASAPRNLRIDFQTANGMTDPIIQVLLLEAGETLKDIHKSDLATYSKTINMSGIEKVVIIVGSKENAGDFTLTMSEIENNSDVMITRWNSLKDNEYQMNPKGYNWHWISPDVMVDNDDDLLADTDVFFDQNNNLKVRLRNKGTDNANDIQVEFWYQKAVPYLTVGGWIPVENVAGVTQVITGETLNAGQEKWVGVDWAPANDGTDHHHWCVKVKITSVGDSNIDNKLTFNNFTNVVLGGDPDFDLLLRHPLINRYDKVEFIPRGPKYDFELLNPAIEVVRKKPLKDNCKCGNAVTAKSLTDMKFAKIRPLKKKKRAAWNEKITTSPMENNFYYPVDARSLPPGVNPQNLVTVAHVIDGDVVGGVTYNIKEEYF